MDQHIGLAHGAAYIPATAPAGRHGERAARPDLIDAAVLAGDERVAGHEVHVLDVRTVDGVEYLTRYTQEDGKKGRSLGRRSPETEAQMAHFENTVLKARRIRREYREDVLLTCKLAKAHGIARLHGRFGHRYYGA